MKITIRPSSAVHNLRATRVAEVYVRDGHADSGRRRRRDCILYQSPTFEGPLFVVWGDREHVRVDVRVSP